uniref:Uncharacterized protein n=1 Tax=Catharus ustulatus TaxID=91951 RepID=A0A8C3UAD0_CATUS
MGGHHQARGLSPFLLQPRREDPDPAGLDSAAGTDQRDQWGRMISGAINSPQFPWETQQARPAPCTPPGQRQEPPAPPAETLNAPLPPQHPSKTSGVVVVWGE